MPACLRRLQQISSMLDDVWSQKMLLLAATTVNESLLCQDFHSPGQDKLLLRNVCQGCWSPWMMSVTESELSRSKCSKQAAVNVSQLIIMASNIFLALLCGAVLQRNHQVHCLLAMQCRFRTHFQELCRA